VGLAGGMGLQSVTSKYPVKHNDQSAILSKDGGTDLVSCAAADGADNFRNYTLDAWHVCGVDGYRGSGTASAVAMKSAGWVGRHTGRWSSIYTKSELRGHTQTLNRTTPLW